MKQCWRWGQNGVGFRAGARVREREKGWVSGEMTENGLEEGEGLKLEIEMEVDWSLRWRWRWRKGHGDGNGEGLEITKGRRLGGSWGLAWRWDLGWCWGRMELSLK